MTTETWTTFEQRIAQFAPRDRRDLHFAYQIAKYAHRGQTRASKEAYFEHLRAAALILLDECGIRDPSLTIAALLHDSLEDSAVFGNSQRMSDREWMLEAGERLTLNFGAEAAEIVLSVTKPKVNYVDILTKDQALAEYYCRLRQAPPQALLVKMADRLHNLRTQFATSPEKQRRKLRETLNVYFPMFERVMETYPNEGAYLLAEMRKEIDKLQESERGEA